MSRTGQAVCGGCLLTSLLSPVLTKKRNGPVTLWYQSGKKEQLQHHFKLVLFDMAGYRPDRDLVASSVFYQLAPIYSISAKRALVIRTCRVLATVTVLCPAVQYNSPVGILWVCFLLLLDSGCFDRFDCYFVHIVTIVLRLDGYAPYGLLIFNKNMYL
jgi:hypothetical protein